jgi:hypothetical protein
MGEPRFQLLSHSGLLAYSLLSGLGRRRLPAWAFAVPPRDWDPQELFLGPKQGTFTAVNRYAKYF